MPVAVNQPQRRESGLDNLVKALQVAQSIYGIKTDMSKAKLLKEQQERETQIAQEKAGREKTEFEQKQADWQNQNSPDSQESILGRKVAEQAGYKVSPTTTAAQLKNTPGLKEVVESLAKSKATAQTAEPKENQGRAALFGKMMEQAEQDFSNLTRSGFDPTSRMAATGNAITPEPFKGENWKLQKQAERNFLAAYLRRTSGASIKDEEIEEGAVQFFPRPGDTPAVIEQKAANRALAIESLKMEAGHFWGKVKIPPRMPLDQSKAGGFGVPGVQDAQAKAAPEIGAVQKGYRFRGGDPANPKSWEKVK